MDLTDRICARAHKLGFDLAGIVPARPAPCVDAYLDWLQSDFHGEMRYMAREDRIERRKDPSVILPGVQSLICVGLNYYRGTLPDTLRQDPRRGLISNYAWGTDYHERMLSGLEELASFVRHETDGPMEHRSYVDTGPILERAYAAAAGLGFVGKNTCLIHPRGGSWLFLGELLLTIKLRSTAQEVRASCGICQRCLDACPTGALVAPRVLDARRCISYLTIELKGPIPADLRPLIGQRIYGCDICQEVCPWQRFATAGNETAFAVREPDHAAPLLVDLMAMDERQFHARFAGSPVLRTGRARLLRNVAVALGNGRAERALPALTRALTDPEPLIRGHAAWAVGHIGGRQACKTLAEAWRSETDPYVRGEIHAAQGVHNGEDTTLPTAHGGQS